MLVRVGERIVSARHTENGCLTLPLHGVWVSDFALLTLPLTLPGCLALPPAVCVMGHLVGRLWRPRGVLVV